MSEQKTKIIIAAVSAALLVVMIFGVSYNLLPSENGSPSTPLPSPQSSIIPVPSGTPTSLNQQTPLPTLSTVTTPASGVTSPPAPLPTPSVNPSISPNSGVPIPSPIEPSASSNATSIQQTGLSFSLSPYPGVDGTLYLSQGATITLNLTLTSLSKDTTITVPIFLAVGAFKNQPLPAGYMIIAKPLAPYDGQLPWPASDVDSSNQTKPLNGIVASNPIVLAPTGTNTTTMIIQAAQTATPGAYSVIVAFGNSQQTHIGGTTFQLTVTSSNQGQPSSTPSISATGKHGATRPPFTILKAPQPNQSATKISVESWSLDSISQVISTDVPLTVSILSPTNNSVVGSLVPANYTYSIISFPLIYETSKETSWVGYSINGNSNITVTSNKTEVYPPVQSPVFNLTLYANDTQGNWATSQTFYYYIAAYLGPTPSPSPTVQEFPSWVALILTIVLVVAALIVVNRKKLS